MNDAKLGERPARFWAMLVRLPVLRIEGHADTSSGYIFAERVLGLPQETHADNRVPLNTIPEGN